MLVLESKGRVDEETAASGVRIQKYPYTKSIINSLIYFNYEIFFISDT